jgi:hypothetical protein
MGIAILMAKIDYLSVVPESKSVFSAIEWSGANLLTLTQDRVDRGVGLCMI